MAFALDFIFRAQAGTAAESSALRQVIMLSTIIEAVNLSDTLRESYIDSHGPWDPFLVADLKLNLEPIELISANSPVLLGQIDQEDAEPVRAPHHVSQPPLPLEDILIYGGVIGSYEKSEPSSTVVSGVPVVADVTSAGAVAVIEASELTVPLGSLAETSTLASGLSLSTALGLAGAATSIGVFSAASTRTLDPVDYELKSVSLWAGYPRKQMRVPRMMIIILTRC